MGHDHNKQAPVKKPAEAQHHDHATTTSKPEQKTTSEPKTNTKQEQAVFVCPMHPEVKSDKPGKCPKCGMALVPVKQGNKRVKGYPQDMWMPMDEAVAKPETYGMAKDWSAATMGMMTYVRVLTPEMYDKVKGMIKE